MEICYTLTTIKSFQLNKHQHWIRKRMFDSLFTYKDYPKFQERCNYYTKYKDHYHDKTSSTS